MPVRNTINCPNCQSSIEITEVMSAQLSAQIRADVEKDVAAKRHEIEKLAEQVKQRETELETRSSQVEVEVAKRTKEERERVFAERGRLPKKTCTSNCKVVSRNWETSRNRSRNPRRRSWNYKSSGANFKTAAEALELEVARQINEQRSEIRKKALEDADEQHRLTMAEKDSQIQGLLKKIDELKRKAEQGSQQTQGEVQEVALEELLQTAFPTDSIEPVAKGSRGADTVQGVLDGTGLNCGQILWESKHTRLGAMLGSQKPAMTSDLLTGRHRDRE